MQRWYSLQMYSKDYLELVYRYYANAGTSYVCTYYLLDMPNSVIDKDTLDGGSYHITGDLSGKQWKKIMLFSIYNTETVSLPFSADERGMGKFDQMSGFNFPSVYGVNPGPGDVVHFEELPLNKDYKENTQGPLYVVRNIEKATNTDVTFWKVVLGSTHIRKNEIENHVNESLCFVDTEKKIFEAQDAVSMLSLEKLHNQIQFHDKYKPTCGYYLDI